MKYSFLIVLFFAARLVIAQPSPAYNLNFTDLATRWDEAIPLGNGQLGALIWKKKYHPAIPGPR
ncbi:glycoside hydrolase family 95 protein [Sphingobacterium sp. E70]|uniref:glycoside hydrolase family 95 protein n=1 Tax=Sphingobacterium sp. E70 TaxID=2853439 RepID=UPI00211C3A0D|nr:glycoside hydrolase family 95 protein [Sphingobacterium sp. E70]ULT24324.1 glycoside hydrolase family 95 protein [Sphingobacterium sp. E70]